MVFLSSLLMWSVTLVAVQMLNQPAIPLGREPVGHVCTCVYTHTVGFDLLKPVFRDCSVASCARLADNQQSADLTGGWGSVPALELDQQRSLWRIGVVSSLDS